MYKEKIKIFTSILYLYKDLLCSFAKIWIYEYLLHRKTVDLVDLVDLTTLSYFGVFFPTEPHS